MRKDLTKYDSSTGILHADNLGTDSSSAGPEEFRTYFRLQWKKMGFKEHEVQYMLNRTRASKKRYKRHTKKPYNLLKYGRIQQKIAFLR